MRWLSWFVHDRGCDGSRALYRLSFYIGLMLMAWAFFSIYYDGGNGGDDGGDVELSPADQPQPDGLKVPKFETVNA